MPAGEKPASLQGPLKVELTGHPVILGYGRRLALSLSLECESSGTPSTASVSGRLSEVLARALLGEDLDSITGWDRVLAGSLLYGGLIIWEVGVASDPIPIGRLHVEGEYVLAPHNGGSAIVLDSDSSILEFWRNTYKTGHLECPVRVSSPKGYAILTADSSGCRVPPVGYLAHI